MNNHTKAQHKMDDQIVISPEEIAGVDFSLFDADGIELPDELRTADNVLANLGGIERDAAISDSAPDPQLALFPEAESENTLPATIPADPERVRELWSIVARAYADVRIDRSIDYVVAEPEANLLFLQRCWELGAAASPFELNWVLMNARKDGKFDSLNLSRSTKIVIPKERLDLFSFAADMAMRCVQDRLYYDQQKDVSIDKVLCDPHLAKQFDQLAYKIAPGFSSFDYRWAVMSLRKARRKRSVLSAEPGFVDKGLVEDIRVSQLPDHSGVYWITAGQNSLFMGVAGSLRAQIDALVGRLGGDAVPDWMPERSRVKPVLRLLECPSDISNRTQSALLRQSGSLLNFRIGNFFGVAA
jgi:hypothetical protein